MVRRRIWLVGGGTAGHVLPLSAVAVELASHRAQVDVVIDQSSTARKIIDEGGPWRRVLVVPSGKFRRYQGRAWRERLVDVSTVVFNLRDSLLVLLGFLWSSVLLLLHRPHVVFINGGAVGVPVALACRLTRVPYVVHESDVKPGLANRLIIKRAKRVLYGLALAESADQSKSFVVGIPSRPIFAHLARTPVATLKQRHGIDPKRPVVVVTGGSQGAQRLNSLLLAIAGDLSRRADVIHQAGLADQNRVRAAAPAHHYRVEGFMAGDALPEALAMADVVVARSGATTIADLAILSKPAIFIPNPHLARHQGVNADRLQAASAAVVLAEADLVAEPHRLLSAVVALLEDGRRRVALGRSLHRLAAKPHAIVDIARHILEVAEGV